MLLFSEIASVDKKVIAKEDFREKVLHNVEDNKSV